MGNTTSQDIHTWRSQSCLRSGFSHTQVLIFTMIASLGWLCVVAVLVTAAAKEGLEVEVTGGVVKGAVRTSKNGREYHAFNAIPYAQPPVNRSRFKPPVPGVEWSGVLDVSKDGEPCAQAALGIVAGVEDCLNLYVYTPKVPVPGENVSLPVVVWLHGGSFVVGGAAALDESFLLDRDLVLVVPQYRLGLFGFFATIGGSSPGNMGMMDQAMALRWVHDNIKVFGGDPNQVTLAGDCAGGSSAIYHMMSPLSQGLFHRVLSLSGSPLTPWSFYANNHRFMLILANYIRCPPNDMSLLIKCFQEIEQSELLEGAQMLFEGRDLLIGNHRMAPSIQVPSQAHETTLFLDRHPLHALTSGDIAKVPVLLGVTRDVGSYLVDLLFYEFVHHKMEKDEEFLPKILPMLLKETMIPDPQDHVEEFEDFYFPGITFDNFTSMLPGLAVMLGDIHFKSGILSAAKLLSENVPTRLMRYEFEGGPSLFNLRWPDPSSAPPMPLSVGHGDEMALILPDQPHHLTPEQREMGDALLHIIENYAYGRAPREDWPIFTSEGQESLVVGSDGAFFRERFTTPERTEMLHKIHTYHQHVALKKLAEEAVPHDEL